MEWKFNQPKRELILVRVTTTLLIDVDLPKDLSQRIGKDANHVHMGDGSTCKELKLGSGKHVIRTLFANGGHVPYNPAITSTVIVTVK